MWTESNTPSKIEGAGGADVPKALIYCHTPKTEAGKRRVPMLSYVKELPV